MIKISFKQLLDEIYDGPKKRFRVFTTYMKKKILQKCILDFSNMSTVSDGSLRPEQNILIEAEAIDITYSDMDHYDDNLQFYLVAPLKTFVKMFKKIGFDLRDKQGKYEIHFRIFNQKLMQVEYYRCGDEVFINEKKSENSDK